MSLRKAVGREVDVFGDVLTDCRCGKGFCRHSVEVVEVKRNGATLGVTCKNQPHNHVINSTLPKKEFDGRFVCEQLSSLKSLPDMGI